MCAPSALRTSRDFNVCYIVHHTRSVRLRIATCIYIRQRANYVALKRTKKTNKQKASPKMEYRSLTQIDGKRTCTKRSLLRTGNLNWRRRTRPPLFWHSVQTGRLIDFVHCLCSWLTEQYLHNLKKDIFPFSFHSIYGYDATRSTYMLFLSHPRRVYSIVNR